MSLTDEEREILDNADPEAVKQFRENDGERLRALLRALRANEEPDAQELYKKLLHHPALRDLIPH